MAICSIPMPRMIFQPSQFAYTYLLAIPCLLAEFCWIGKHKDHFSVYTPNVYSNLFHNMPDKYVSLHAKRCYVYIYIYTYVVCYIYIRVYIKY